MHFNLLQNIVMQHMSLIFLKKQLKWLIESKRLLHTATIFKI